MDYSKRVMRIQLEMKCTCSINVALYAGSYTKHHKKWDLLTAVITPEGRDLHKLTAAISLANNGRAREIAAYS